MDRWVASSVSECVSDPVTWFGQQPLAPGETMAVASVVALPGEQLRVAAFDTEPVSLTVLLDGAPLVAGIDLVGGSFTVANVAAEPFVLSSVAIDLQRCHQVESLVPPPVAPAPTAAVTQAVARTSPAGLPETGTASLPLALTATVAVLVGLVLWWVSRRRAH